LLFYKMDKFIKIQSNQSEFSNTANLVDFVIPQGDVYDLSDSWCNLEFQIDVTETETASGVGVYNMQLEYATTDTEKPYFFNTAVVRDCRMENSRQGIIESLIRSDILSQVRQTYEKTWGEIQSERYMSGTNAIDPINKQVYGITRQFNKEGINKSVVNNNANIMVRLGDLMDFCNTPEYDTNRGGQTRIHFRLNLDRIGAVQNMLDGNIAPAEVKQCKKITTVGVVNAVTLGKDDGTANLKVSNLDQVPYYVGMKVLISATGNGAPGTKTDEPAVIETIVWNRDAGTYTLTFEQNWGDNIVTSPADYYDAITIKPSAPIASSSVKLAQAQLVLKRVNNPQGMDAIDYTTFSVEQGFGNNQQAFSDVFVVEPQATNMIMTFQDGAEDLISKNNQLETYQVAVDNVPLTDRLVTKNSPLDYDRKSATFRRIGGGLRNLTENAGDASDQTWATTFADVKFNSTIVASPLPLSDRQKNLQVSINGSAGGVGKYAIFKSLPSRLSY
jgi:hypothetical protein